MFPPKVIEAQCPTCQRLRAVWGGLTRREGEVLQLMTQGLSNTAISDLLTVGQKSVENYVNAIYRKLLGEERDRSQAPRVLVVKLYNDHLRSVPNQYKRLPSRQDIPSPQELAAIAPY